VPTAEVPRHATAGEADAVALVVMAKAPVPGFAKTRLVPALGEAGAARLAGRFLQATLHEALAAGLGPVTLSAAPEAGHPAFTPWLGEARITREDQPTGDLGVRMASAFTRAFGHQPSARAVLLFGTDAPALQAAVLQRAAQALQQHEAVFVPTLDGGYVLVGLRRDAMRALPALFTGMPWSTPEVMPMTRARLAEAGVAWAELAPMADVDEPADLVHVPPAWLAGV